MDPSIDNLFTLPDTQRMLAVSVRLVAAALFGGFVGAERESVGKAAGLRTHMLVALGAALFVLAPQQLPLGEGDLGEIIGGIAAGIGFIGAGAILKIIDREEIKGLTTASGIWLTAAVGAAAAVAPLWLSLLSSVCAWVILYVIGKLESRRHPTNQA